MVMYIQEIKMACTAFKMIIIRQCQKVMDYCSSARIVNVMLYNVIGVYWLSVRVC